MKSVYVVKSNAVDGREGEYNQWYDDHIVDVLAVKGFTAAQRYTLADHPKNETAPFKYVTVFEIDGEPAEALTALNAARDGGMQISDALHPTREAYLYTALGDRVEG